MNSFKIIYTFEKDVKVTEVVEAENKSEVIGKIKDLEGFVEMTDSEDQYHRFDFADVKLVTITE
ncbi:hypothetical protein [Cytobacillus sp. NCCP-133]|uniref:hypothetical protein n=1 Tax=Cytobacillus sp. NCCP-133 TaxID=766848 RepID=UPI00223001F2|nr:hypothetical protein [Cytobacillus sp. NCCP-133]GLB60840.1 hypothetical protein NCCP133_29720 [Cytobacillus sp. NCCP-133]